MGVDLATELKTEVIAELYELRISTKALHLLAGISASGKTVTCLHFALDAVKKGHKVLYFDTEKKKAATRPEPNLLKKFYAENKKTFDNLFVYEIEFDQETALKEISEEKPKLVIIDSIYEPFIDIKHPYQRAVAIREFLNKLREKMMADDFGCVITTQVGREDTRGGEKKETVLGGDGLKYVSDLKAFIQLPDNTKKEGELYSKRFFVIDNQTKYPFKIEEGGIIKPAK